ncbi:4-hydroxythreonine-4-phosphate dehydrogenase PdxA [Candidatus Margulisiibacteriota bacterium]
MKKFIISMGCPFGIGPEIINKAISKKQIPLKNTVIVGSRLLIKNINAVVVDPSPINQKIYTAYKGRDSQKSGQLSMTYLNTALELVKEDSNNTALVTCPISKYSWWKAGFLFNGHTDYLANYFKTKRYTMAFYTKDIILFLATIHVPLKNVSKIITTKRLSMIYTLALDACKQLKILKPTIAIAGLNPHAGEKGVLGTEENNIITPFIKKQSCAFGPFPSDTFFSTPAYKQYDAYIAMYHDQGLAPIKTLYFSTSVNWTVGLPIIRTSVDHGTAYTIVGMNKADHTNLVSAYRFAQKLLKQ